MSPKLKGIPLLRFPSFNREWEPVTISEVANKITDGTHDTPKPIGDGVPFLTAIHVKDGFIDFDNCYYLPEEEHRKIYSRCNPEHGDLLMVNIGAGTATSAIIEVEYEFSLKNVALVKPNRDRVDPRFFSQYQRFHSARLRHQVSSGGAQPFLSLRQIGKLKLDIAPLPEQRKIADFLTAVDGRIGQLIQKKALLVDYKKGVMQQLFTQAIRFKDDHGNDFPDWEEKKLGGIGTSYSGLSGKSGADFGRGKPFVTYKQVFDQSTIDLQKCGNVEIKPTESQNSVKKGDVLFTISSETRLEVGYTSVVMDDVAELYLNSFCFGFRMENRNELSPEFARYLFHSNDARRSISVLGQGSTRYNISKNKLMKQPFLIPSIPEQTKIADFLSAIDRKTESVATQITNTQTFKRGLLQQMFV